jgi:hypothetical protein
MLCNKLPWAVGCDMKLLEFIGILFS